jgi:lysine 2,3-aminomutase
MKKMLQKYFKCSNSDWNNWIWQEKNAIQNSKALFKLLPNLSKYQKNKILKSEKFLRFKLTPHLISLIMLDNNLRPIKNDPIWNQFIPIFNKSSKVDISSYNENWELPNEMINPILQHKYFNRVNFRIQNKCLAYCMYCFEAKRVLDKDSNKKATYNNALLEHSIEYIKKRTNIQEIVISGGEPLILSNERLGFILREFRKINHIKCIRIQTRALVHNPFRINEELIDILNEFDVNAMAFHICHPNEISVDSLDILQKFITNSKRTILLAHIPLLKGINDKIAILIHLFMKLYEIGIKPYYLIHAMPDTLGAEKFRTDVQKGVKILRKIRRNYSNPSLPEYIIVHKDGKHTVPIELSGTSEFNYRNNKIKFLNWRGKWCIYDNL